MPWVTALLSWRGCWEVIVIVLGIKCHGGRGFSHCASIGEELVVRRVSVDVWSRTWRRSSSKVKAGLVRPGKVSVVAGVSSSF